MNSREGVISPIPLEKIAATTPPSEADVEEGYLRGYYASHSQAQSELHVPVNEKPRSASVTTFPPRLNGPPGGWLAEPMTRNREILFNVMICMVQIIPQACLTTCFPIIQILNQDFNISSPAVLPWVVSAYAVSFGTTILLAGRLGDIFGHKNAVILGFAWLSFWSVVTGLSRYSTYEVFFVGRAMQGLGAATMNPNALALLGRSYPPGSKAKIITFSAFGLCAPLGAYIGMLGASILGQLAHWSWCFFLLAIASVILALVGMLILPTPPKTPKQMLPFWDKLAQMDWLGGSTGVTGLVCVQVALISAPVEGWHTQYVYMLLIIGLLLAGFFVMIELKVSREPLVPFRLLNTKVAFVLGAVACGWGTFGVWTFYLWRYMLGIRHNTPLLAVLQVFPIVPVAIIASIMTAFLMRKAKPAWILLGALVAFTFGAMFLSLNSANSSYWAFTFVSLLITPFGMDMSFPSATFIMSDSLPHDKQGVAGSLVTTVVNYSISLGLGLASTVEVYTNDRGQNIMKGIRSGWFFGTGLGALGIVICAVFVLRSTMKPKTESGKSPTPPISEERYTMNDANSITPSVQEELRMSGIFPSNSSIVTQPTRMHYQQSNTSQMPIMHTKSFSLTHTESEIMSISERDRERYLLSPISVAAPYQGTWGGLEPR